MVLHLRLFAQILPQNTARQRPCKTGKSEICMDLRFLVLELQLGLEKTSVLNGKYRASYKTDKSEKASACYEISTG